MVRHVKKYLVPHVDNNFLPHILRARSVSILAVLVIAIFAYSGAREYLFLSTNWGAEVISSALVDFTNADRTNLSLPRLSTSAVLEKAAQLKADDMAMKGYFAHNSPDGKTPWHWFEAVGYDYQYAGENLAINFTESRDVETAWMNSPGHRSNILSWYFSEVGIATAQGYYNGQPTVFVVQMFGQPKKSFAVAPTFPVVDTVIPETVVEKNENVLSENIIPVEPEPKPEPLPPRIVETETMIAVLPAHSESNIPVDVVDSVTLDNVPVQASPRDSFPLYGGGLPSGKKAIHYVYYIIATLLLIPLFLLLRHELKTHHYRHIAYGSGLLFVMAFLLVIFDLVISPVGGII